MLRIKPTGRNSFIVFTLKMAECEPGNGVEPNIQDGAVDDVDDVDDVPENIESTTERDIPIDRGWAWMTVVACFFTHALVVGASRCLGVLALEISDRFPGVPDRQLGLVQGINMTLMLGIGLLANMLSARFTARLVVFVGGLLASLGLYLTAFITEFWMVYVTYSIIAGVGFGLSYSPCMGFVGSHFVKRKTLASGISLAGSGIGTFVLSSLIPWLTRVYGLPGCCMIISALLLHVCACALLLRPHSNYRRKAVKDNVGAVDDHYGNEPAGGGNREGANRNGARNIPNGARVDEDGVEQAGEVNVGDIGNGNAGNGNASANGNARTRSKIPRKNNRRESFENPLYEGERPDFSNEEGSFVRGALSSFTQRLPVLPFFQRTRQQAGEQPQRRARNDQNNEIEECNGFLNNPENKNRLDQREASTLSISMLFSSQTASRVYNRKHPNSEPKPRLFEWSLLSNPVFLIYFLFCMLANFCYPTVYFMLPSHSEMKHPSRNNAALLVSIVGIFDLAGRLVIGYLADSKYFHRRYGFVACCVVSGLASLSVPYLDYHWCLAIYAVVYGFCSGGCLVLVAVLLADVLGPDRFPSSFGLVTIALCVGLIPGPVVVGTLRDSTGSWDTAFSLLGFITLASSILPLMQPLAEKLQRHRDNMERTKKS